MVTVDRLPPDSLAENIDGDSAKRGKHNDLYDGGFDIDHARQVL